MLNYDMLTDGCDKSQNFTHFGSLWVMSLPVTSQHWHSCYTVFRSHDEETFYPIKAQGVIYLVPHSKMLCKMVKVQIYIATFFYIHRNHSTSYEATCRTFKPAAQSLETKIFPVNHQTLQIDGPTHPADSVIHLNPIYWFPSGQRFGAHINPKFSLDSNIIAFPITSTTDKSTLSSLAGGSATF